MNLSKKVDKKLQSNLKTLLLCSKYKTISLSYLADKIQQNQKDILFSPKNKELRDFLERVYIAESRKQGISYTPPVPDHYLTTLVVPQSYSVPNSIGAEFEQHQKNATNLGEIYQSQKEHEELRQLLYVDSQSGRISGIVDLPKLQAFLKDKSHSTRFQAFGKSMLDGNQMVILARYKRSAEKLADDANLTNVTFSERIAKTFTARDVKLGLDKEFRGRLFSGGRKLATYALTGLLAINGLLHLKPDDTRSQEDVTTSHSVTVEDPTIQTDPVIPTEPSTDEQTDNPVNPYDNQVVEVMPSVTPPISNGVAIDSYETAAQDLFQKTEEIYSYNNPGYTIDLSDLRYDDIGQGTSEIFVATYNGKEYRFSGMSEFYSNSANLQQALEAVGATVTTYTDKISYISREDKSIAIADSKGNPIQSGKVLEPAGKGEMYNQEWIKYAKRMMENAGISTEGKTEAEFIGYYLLNTQPEQNPELSKALGEVSDLVSYMKSTFYYDKNGRPDQYALQQYTAKSHKFAENFNNKALGITQDENFIDERE